MAYVQNTDDDRSRMLGTLGLASVDDLFTPIPPALRRDTPIDIPGAASEEEIAAELSALAARNRSYRAGPCFLGAGNYDHTIPVVVDEIVGRSEFLTAYTPYQPEASQGTLQAIFEFQTMISELCGLPIANASMYDGASALAEAVLMGLRVTRRRKVYLPDSLDPFARRTVATYLANLDAELVVLPSDPETGRLSLDFDLDGDSACLVAGHPNYLGAIEDLRAIGAKAREARTFFVVHANPVSLALLVAPGDCGADVVTGDGQPLGVPASSGGPSFGFFAARAEHVRTMPGRLVGRTVDRRGKQGYVLTFQTREQHIRREKASSNICTNHSLIALRGAVAMAALGRSGFVEVAKRCLAHAHELCDRLCAIDGFERAQSAPFFYEFALRTPIPPAHLNAKLKADGITGGLDMGVLEPERSGLWLVAATERVSQSDRDRLVALCARIASEARS